MGFQYVQAQTGVFCRLAAECHKINNIFLTLFLVIKKRNCQEGCASVLPAMTKQTLMGVPEVTLGRHGQNVLLFFPCC